MGADDLFCVLNHVTVIRACFKVSFLGTGMESQDNSATSLIDPSELASRKEVDTELLVFALISRHTP